MRKEYLPDPDSQKFAEIEDGFNNLWDMPNCVGAIDGKHIAIKAPPNSGDVYLNDKKYFSIVLMASCDAEYKFTLASIGDVGGSSDDGTFASSNFGRLILENTIGLPPGKPLPGTDTIFDHYFVGDAAYPLKPNLMKPYPGNNLPEDKKIFNYRLSRAKRTIENAFGILLAR